MKMLPFGGDYYDDEDYEEPDYPDMNEYGDIEEVRLTHSPVPTPGTNNGVHIQVATERLEWLVAKFDQWFDGWQEVMFVASGQMEYSGAGFIILEWEGHEIDELFLRIISNEEMIEDYAVYSYGGQA